MAIRKGLRLWRRLQRGRLEAEFATVYHDRLWPSQESASGEGSDRSALSVARSMNLLERVTREFGVSSIADIPCGDFHWMPLLLEKRPEIQYTGYDIVSEIIASNRRHHPDRRFEHLDITRQVPARADLVFCKDLVNHLAFEDIWLALANMAASGADYAVISSNTGEPNIDLPARRPPGASRPLDMQGAPFSLPEPVISDGYLSLWRMEAVRQRIADRPQA